MKIINAIIAPGRFEEAVLTSLIRLKIASSASDIRKDLEKQLEKAISIGGLYSTLSRLEKKGLLSSYQQGPSGKPGGRTKSLFLITTKGTESTMRLKDYTRAIWKGINHEDTVFSN